MDKKETEVPAPVVEIETVTTPRLVSYKITATIRTGEYQNIVPEIMVEGGTIEEARTILTQEIDTIRSKYDPSVRRVVAPVQPKPVVPAPTTTAAPAILVATNEQAPEPAPAPVLSTPFQTAEKVILAAKSNDALDMIEAQIKKSVKLNNVEKDTLLMMIIDLHAKNNFA